MCFFHHSFWKFKRERSENIFVGKSDFYWPLMVLAEQRQCSLYANVLSVQSSVPTMFLHLLANRRSRTDGSRLFRSVSDHYQVFDSLNTIVHAIYTYYIPPEYFSVSGRRAIPN